MAQKPKAKLAALIHEDIFALWDSPISDTDPTTRGQAALRVVYADRPADFVKMVFSILPKDVALESHIVNSIPEDELGAIIEAMRDEIRRKEQVLELQAVKALPNGRH
jgi:hypothetical protein